MTAKSNLPESQIVQFYQQGMSCKLISLQCKVHEITIQRRLRKLGVLKKRDRDLAERFWEKVDIGKEDECWEWRSQKEENGYGKFHLNGRPEWAHRVAWILTYGAPKLCVLHKCDNPICVNPSHLFEGTHKQNRQDAMRKGRLPRGGSHSNAKVREEDIPVICAMASRGISYTKIAEGFPIGRQEVSFIVRGIRWKHLF